MAPRLSPLVLASVLLPLTACGEPAPGDDTDDGGDTTTAGDTTDAPPTSDPTTDPPSDPTSSSTGDEATGGSGGDGETEGGQGGTDGDDPSPWDGELLPPADDGEWTWVDVAGSRCRDGSATGIGVRYGASDDLVIFFEGGGACFNLATCLLNDGFANFGALKFDAWKLGAGQGGIFDPDHADNPVADWNVVYVPYCTGDVHAGDREDVGVEGVIGPQQFVGYRNVELALERIVPTFEGAPHVLVTGQSAGGFGAALNYHRIAGAWPKSKVTLFDDSGPPMTDDYLAPCLQQGWRELWNLDVALPEDCAECFHADGGGIHELAGYLAEHHPDQRLGLFSSEQDAVIRTFFGYGENDCAGGLMTGMEFEAGLYDLRDALGDDPAWATFFVSGGGHTIAGGSGFYTAESDGVRLVDWLADLLAGQSAHVSP